MQVAYERWMDWGFELVMGACDRAAKLKSRPARLVAVPVAVVLFVPSLIVVMVVGGVIAGFELARLAWKGYS